MLSLAARQWYAPRMGKKTITCPEELELFADEYFAVQTANTKPFTMAGLARACGLSTTSAFLRYRKDDTHEEFHEVANAAALRIEEYNAEMCYDKRVNVAGPVFILKNMGYTDRPEGQVDTVNIKIEGLAAKL